MAGASLMIKVLPDTNNFIKKEKTRKLACARKSYDLLAAFTLSLSSAHQATLYPLTTRQCKITQFA
jgi:hypothetical protein